MKRFLADRNRGISMDMFADIAGVDLNTIKALFKYETRDVSEIFQIRISNALQAWENGEIAIMRGHGAMKYWEYRKQPKPRLVRNWGLKFTPDGFKMDLRVRNKADYGDPGLLEQMEGPNARKTRL